MGTPTKTAIGRFTWHDLSSTDLDASRRFYTELLGWKVETWKPGEMDYPMISANGAYHGGFGPAQGGASHWIGHVAVEDLEAAVERAQDAGGSLVADPMDIPGIGRIAIIRDPQGAFVSAYQSEGGDPQLPEGVFLWDELLTTDVEGAKRFYGELFGWTANEYDMGVGSDTYTIFQIGETSLAGCMKPREEGIPAHWYPYLATDDVDASAAKAKELGAHVYLEPTSMETVGRFAVLGDPTGTTFGLMKPE